MKKVYQVYGSEDGTLGIFSNIKKAYERAASYLNEGDEATVKSYAQSCKELKTKWSSEVVSYKYEYSCTITKHILNH
tara:strand:- start:158 stop:388 length:231 start_codon:yes stop_codon:yes gene_type:complete